jgi:hypothetical protein
MKKEGGVLAELQTNGPISISDVESKPDGPVVAAFIAAGLGAFFLGLLTTLAEASTRVKEVLNFYDPVGPLSGKTTLAVIAWLVAWGILHVILRRSSVRLQTGMVIGGLLVLLGLIGTFPTFFEAFAAE